MAFIPKIIKHLMPVSEVVPEPDLKPKRYYIFKPRKIKKHEIRKNGKYIIKSIS